MNKCFAILDLLAEEKRALGISRIAAKLKLSKSTVFNLVHTLTELGVLENGEGKFRFGPKLYLLGKMVNSGSDMLRVIHPFMEEVNNKTGLAVFLGLRSGSGAVIMDKADSSVDLKVSTDVGIRIPLVAGAGGKALLARLSPEELDEFLETVDLPRYTPFSCTGQSRFRAQVEEVRRTGVAIDREEYLEGIVAVAVPLDIQRPEIQLALWAVGLKGRLDDVALAKTAALLKSVKARIEDRFYP